MYLNLDLHSGDIRPQHGLYSPQKLKYWSVSRPIVHTEFAEDLYVSKIALSK